MIIFLYSLESSWYVLADRKHHSISSIGKWHSDPLTPCFFLFYFRKNRINT